MVSQRLAGRLIILTTAADSRATFAILPSGIPDQGGCKCKNLNVKFITLQKNNNKIKELTSGQGYAGALNTSDDHCSTQIIKVKEPPMSKK